MKFENEALSSVLVALERYFGTDIEVTNKAVLNCNWKWEYPNPKLDVILNTIAFPLELEISKEATGYRIDGVGCD